MSGWGCVVMHGRIFSNEMLEPMVFGNPALSPSPSDLATYVLFEVGVAVAAVGDRLAKHLAGFRVAKESDLRALYLSFPQDDDAPETDTVVWSPPLVKAAALRRLAEDFRQEAPSALAICSRVKANQYLPGLVREEVEIGYLGKPYYADVAPGDWMRFIARDLEQYARFMEHLAKQGEVSICFELNV